MTDLGFTLWFTGLPCSGKTTLARALSEHLAERDVVVEILDGDLVRRELWPELGFSREARDANVNRVGFVAELLARNGVNVLVALVSPYAAARLAQRERLPRFAEVFVDCPLDECKRRDVKGLYQAQAEGRIKGVTGVDDPYEAPEAPELTLHTERQSLDECVEALMALLRARGFVGST